MEKVPKHIAIIMDGNGRWAQERGLSRSDGHRKGVEQVFEIAKVAKNLGVKYLTIYAFSTENWNRPVSEVNTLMSLLENFTTTHVDDLQKHKIRLKTLGRTSGLPKKVRDSLLDAIEKTKNNRAFTLTMCLNYGGRAEIADAAKKLAKAVKEGKVNPEKIDEKCFSKFLYDPSLPDPDLMIRTSGEFRLSNFLLWELSYSEFYVTKTHWPDFSEKDLEVALKDYSSRNRRYGAIKVSDEKVTKK